MNCESRSDAQIVGPVTRNCHRLIKGAKHEADDTQEADELGERGMRAVGFGMIVLLVSVDVEEMICQNHHPNNDQEPQQQPVLLPGMLIIQLTGIALHLHLQICRNLFFSSYCLNNSSSIDDVDRLLQVHHVLRRLEALDHLRSIDQVVEFYPFDPLGFLPADEEK
jgi:hypothetical protein